jgi:hypothetical protein
VSIDGSKFKKNNKKKSKNAETKIEKNGYLDKIKGFKTSYTDIKDILEEILLLTKNKAEFSGIYIRIRYGTGDAAITGSIYGAIWAITGSIYSFLCRFFKVGFPTLELEPVFGGKVFDFEAEGIITTKLVHIITAIFRSIKIYYKRKKKKECN